MDDFKALTYIHLPFIDKDYKPGDPVLGSDMAVAKQTDDDIANLIEHGSLGNENDDIHPSHIIPDPTMPTIQKVVADARRVMTELEERGEEVPDELRTVASLDYQHVTSSDVGRSVDSNA